MRLIFFLSAAMVLFGCGDFDNFYEARREGARPGSGNPEVLATVGEEEITAGDLEAAIARLPYKQKRLYESSPAKKAEYLDTMINQKVLYAEALKMGIDRRSDIEEKTENFKKQLIGQALAQEILGDIKTGEADARRYYEKNKRDFERVKVRKIVIAGDSGSGAGMAAARSRAESISERAKSGESWDILAAEAAAGKPSESKSEYIQRGELPPDAEERVFGMKKGEVSDPLEVAGGFFIIKAEDRPAPVPFGEVSRKIESEIINGKIVDYVYGLRDEWGVVVYKDRLEESSDRE